MSQHINKIAENLYVLSAERLKPLVVVVDNDNNYVSHYGNLTNYQLPDFTAGDSCVDDLPFLVGLEDESYITLPLVSLNSDMVASIDIIKINQSRFVIMLDATSEHHRQQDTTQASNDTKLLNVKLRQLTEQLKEAQSELKNYNEQLQLVNRAKSRFISGMSHEFRTPISSILGYSNILAKQYSEKDNEYRYARAIERNTKYLLSLIDNVLEHAQLETDNLVLNIAPFHLEELLDDLKVMFAAQAKEAELNFVFEVVDELPKVIESDRIRLQQVLINIFSNAIKYTREGSVSVKVDWVDNKLIVSIVDTGPGISDEYKQSVFEAFSRIQSSGQKGAGLGLSISKQLVEKLGGELELQSEVGVGSVFTISIPAKQVSTVVSEQVSKLSANNEIKILVVEDDEDLVELLKIYLHEFGYSSFAVFDGDDALEQCKTGNFNLMLLDLQLPKLNGIDVAKQLSKSETKIPIIGMTASTNGEDKVNALAAGCDDFIVKPIQATSLFNAINKLLVENA